MKNKNINIGATNIEYTRSLIEASLDPLATISPDGKITDVNRATQNVTGRTREELIGSDFSKYFTEPEKAKKGYEQVFEKGTVRDYPLEIRHKNGKTTPVLYNASVYKDRSGDVIGVFVAARDITELKQAEEELRKSQAQLLQSEKMASVGQLAAGVAHEINNPTGFVSSNLKTLSDYQDDISGIIKEYRKLIGDLKNSTNKEDFPSSIREQVEKIVSLEAL